jgi:hypothetical protein
MAKKLQVFISSTFTDLRDERQGAVQGVLLAKHIPAGMELFSAGDASQLEVIKDWISESDIYLLILGARYGSIEPKSGVGYTEIEYDFAVKSGMPYFALVLSDAAVANKRRLGLVPEEDETTVARLKTFRDRVLSKSSRLVEDPKDIQLYALQSLHEFEKRPSLKGWVRPDDVGNLGPLIAQIRSLTDDNAKLKERAQDATAKPGPDLSVLDKKVKLTVEEQHEGGRGSYWRTTGTYEITWRQLFGVMAMKMLGPANDDHLRGQVGCHFTNNSSWLKARVLEHDWETVKAQFLKLEFVDLRYSETIAKSMALFWHLTPLGKQVGILVRSELS